MKSRASTTRCVRCGGSISGLGSGGMPTKLQATEVANRAGIEVVIAAGGKTGGISDVMAGESVGTRFHGQKIQLESRQRWLFGPPPAGDITVDYGTLKAILQHGSSLLPKGILVVEGNFSRGIVLRIRSTDGRDIAHGVSRYNSDALRMIVGQHSQGISDILGYEYGRVVIYRDDMILC